MKYFIVMKITPDIEIKIIGYPHLYMEIFIDLTHWTNIFLINKQRGNK